LTTMVLTRAAPSRAPAMFLAASQLRSYPASMDRLVMPRSAWNDQFSQFFLIHTWNNNNDSERAGKKTCANFPSDDSDADDAVR
jgi:hypothetical protein